MSLLSVGPSAASCPAAVLCRGGGRPAAAWPFLPLPFGPWPLALTCPVLPLPCRPDYMKGKGGKWGGGGSAQCTMLLYRLAMAVGDWIGPGYRGRGPVGARPSRAAIAIQVLGLCFNLRSVPLDWLEFPNSFLYFLRALNFVCRPLIAQIVPIPSFLDAAQELYAARAINLSR
jgi:hypothetical protein